VPVNGSIHRSLRRPVEQVLMEREDAMAVLTYIKQRAWATLFGYGLFIGMMATGYYYNITFVQLGLVDLGARLIGMSDQAVARSMALLALLTCAVALLTGRQMQRRGWGERFVLKLRLAWAVVCVQAVLTAVAPFIRSEVVLLGWLVVCSVALGVGVPATFSMTVDLIPTRDRGYAAALITAGAYFVGAVFAAPWRIERFSAQMVGPLLLGSLLLGVLTFRRWPWIDALAQQHADPAFGQGRFVVRDSAGRMQIRRSLFGLILLMFAIFFIDSLGFLRLIHTPIYMQSAWQAPEWGPRLFIGGTHVLAALVAGVLYAALNERQLFFWIFGIFALVQLMYVFDVRFAPWLPDSEPTLSLPMLYATAVSLYTVVNFAVWADISTPRTISLRVALGIALSGWTATFMSTALALQWRVGGMSLDRHLSVVAALALLSFTAVLAMLFFRTGSARSPDRRRT
jgi:MFS family permease